MKEMAVPMRSRIGNLSRIRNAHGVLVRVHFAPHLNAQGRLSLLGVSFEVLVKGTFCASSRGLPGEGALKGLGALL